MSLRYVHMNCAGIISTLGSLYIFPQERERQRREEEMARLRKLQEEMEHERKLREEEERRKKQEEEERRR